MTIFFILQKGLRQMKIKSENYLTIQGWMRTELNLSGNDLLVYAIIYGFCQDGESGFTLSLQYLADWCGATKQGIQKNLKNLLDRNLVRKDSCIHNGITCVVYRTTELYTVQLSCTNNTSISSITSNTNISNNTSNKQDLFISEEKESKNKEDKSGKVYKFVDDYNSICKSLPKCERLTPKRSKAIAYLLKNYSYDDILQVFDNLENSDFCKGANDRGWKANIDFILREDKFVSTLEGRYNSKSKRTNVEIKSGGEVRQLSAEEKERIRKYGQKF